MTEPSGRTYISFDAFLILQKANPEGIDYGGLGVDVAPDVYRTKQIPFTGENFHIFGHRVTTTIVQVDEKPWQDKFPYGKAPE